MPKTANDGTELLALAVYNARETAAHLRVSERKLRQLVKEGRLRPQGYARQHLFFGRDVIAFLEGETSTP